MRTVGQRGNISSSLSTCSWFSAKTWVISALSNRTKRSRRPSHPDRAAPRWRRASAPRTSPHIAAAGCRPARRHARRAASLAPTAAAASAAASSASSRQVTVRQMPRFFSRMAGRSPRSPRVVKEQLWKSCRFLLLRSPSIWCPDALQLAEQPDPSSRPAGSTHRHDKRNSEFRGSLRPGTPCERVMQTGITLARRAFGIEGFSMRLHSGPSVRTRWPRMPGSSSTTSIDACPSHGPNSRSPSFF